MTEPSGTLVALHEAHKARKLRFFPPRALPEKPEPVLPPKGKAKPKEEPLPQAEVIELELHRLVRQASNFLDNPTNAEAPKLKARHVIKAVAEFYKVRPELLISQTRVHTIAWPRQVSMFLCVKLLGISTPETGRRHGGRDHTTVLHAMNKVHRLRQVEERVRDELQLIVMKLAQRHGIDPGALS
jgi:hypothetical protein